MFGFVDVCLFLGLVFLVCFVFFWSVFFLFIFGLLFVSCVWFLEVVLVLYGCLEW
jgi:hypothetical protein